MKVNGEEIECFNVWGEEQGLIKDGFKTLKEVYEFIQDLKASDRREGIEDIYSVEVETKNYTIGDYKIRKRGSNYYLS